MFYEMINKPDAMSTFRKLVLLLWRTHAAKPDSFNSGGRC